MTTMLRIPPELDELIRKEGKFGESKGIVLLRLINGRPFGVPPVASMVQSEMKRLKELEVENKVLKSKVSEKPLKASYEHIYKWIKEKRGLIGKDNRLGGLLDEFEAIL